MKPLRLSPRFPSKPMAEADLDSKAPTTCAILPALLAAATRYVEKADVDRVTASAASDRVGAAKGNGVSSGVRSRGAGW